ncbi:MAG: hypothetical protein ACR2PH_05565 [Desulfobulbia bacterium]
MFQFISYTYPGTTELVSIAIEDYFFTGSITDKINSFFPKLNLTSDCLISSYVSDKPMHEEDVWVYIMADGKQLNRNKKEFL